MQPTDEGTYADSNNRVIYGMVMHQRMRDLGVPMPFGIRSHKRIHAVPLALRIHSDTVAEQQLQRLRAPCSALFDVLDRAGARSKI